MIFDDSSVSASIEIRDGSDYAFIQNPFPHDSTVPQTFTFASSDFNRTANLAMFFGSVSGTESGGGFRPSAIEITIDKGLVTETITELNNQLDSLDGEEWDTLTVPVNITAGATAMTVQALSENRGITSGQVASFNWITAGLSVPTPVLFPPPC